MKKVLNYIHLLHSGLARSVPLLPPAQPHLAQPPTGLELLPAGALSGEAGGEPIAGAQALRHQAHHLLRQQTPDGGADEPPGLGVDGGAGRGPGGGR